MIVARERMSPEKVDANIDIPGQYTFITMGFTAWERRVAWWWLGFALALLLLLPFDLLTTLLAVKAYGTTVEANPIMRWLLEQGLFSVVLVYVVVAGAVVYLFSHVIERFRQLPHRDREHFAHLINFFLGVWIVAGALVVSNNLLAVL